MGRNRKKKRMKIEKKAIKKKGNKCRKEEVFVEHHSRRGGNMWKEALSNSSTVPGNTDTAQWQ